MVRGGRRRGILNRSSECGRSGKIGPRRDKMGGEELTVKCLDLMEEGWFAAEVVCMALYGKEFSLNMTLRHMKI